MAQDIFTPRPITPPWEGGGVSLARGVARYEAGDVDVVYEAAPIMIDESGKRRNRKWVKKFTRSGGWVLPKHRTFDHLPAIQPQLGLTKPWSSSWLFDYATPLAPDCRTCAERARSRDAAVRRLA